MNRLKTWTAVLGLILVIAPAASGSSPVAGSWSRLPAAPIAPDGYLTSVWTGRQMIVFGRSEPRQQGVCPYPGLGT